jgi:hypothetical protein
MGMRMGKILLLILIPFLVSPVFAGEKLYTDDDLENYRYRSDPKPGETSVVRGQENLDRISYFDITDIDMEITKLNEKIEKSKKNESKEISNRCISGRVMPHPHFQDAEIFIDNPASEAACEEAITNKYEKYRENLSQEIYMLKNRQQRLKELYEMQEQREKIK